jgi:hypothetical protein
VPSRGSVKSGFRPGRHQKPVPASAEIRLLILTDQVRDLSRELTRLRAAVSNVLTATPEDQPVALHRLRLEHSWRGGRP